MKLKLVKIVYGYDIDRDMIAARQYFLPAGPDEPADRDIGEDNQTIEMMTVARYTKKEWEDLLYKLRSQRRAVEIVKVAEEMTR